MKPKYKKLHDWHKKFSGETSWKYGCRIWATIIIIMMTIPIPTKKGNKAVMEDKNKKITKGKLSFSLSLNRQPKRKSREELFLSLHHHLLYLHLPVFFTVKKMLLARLVTFEGNQWLEGAHKIWKTNKDEQYKLIFIKATSEINWKVYVWKE